MNNKSKKNEMPKCIGAANKIIDRVNAHNYWRATNGIPRLQMTGKRLQKLLYICQLVWLIDHDKSEMITDDFQAWPNGPVIPEIYNSFKVWQEGDMQPALEIVGRELTDEEADIINRVIDNTMDISTEAMIEYSHNTNPWKDVYNNTVIEYATITQQSIKNYIKELENQEIFFDFISNKRISLPKTKKLK